MSAAKAMNLGAKIPRSVLGQPEPSVDSRQFMFEADALYRLYRSAPGDGMGGYLDLVAGAPYNKVRAAPADLADPGHREVLRPSREDQASLTPPRTA